MAFLTLPTVGDVPVSLDAGSAVAEREPVGGRRRAIDGSMHSSVRAYKGSYRVRLRAVPRATGDSIVAVLEGTMPIVVNGDLVGGLVAMDCHAEPGSIEHPKFADGEYQLIEFTLHEE
jgi:hypothetical protein